MWLGEPSCRFYEGHSAMTAALAGFSVSQADIRLYGVGKLSTPSSYSIVDWLADHRSTIFLFTGARIKIWTLVGSQMPTSLMCGTAVDMLVDRISSIRFMWDMMGVKSTT